MEQFVAFGYYTSSLRSACHVTAQFSSLASGNIFEGALINRKILLIYDRRLFSLSAWIVKWKERERESHWIILSYIC